MNNNTESDNEDKSDNNIESDTKILLQQIIDTINSKSIGETSQLLFINNLLPNVDINISDNAGLTLLHHSINQKNTDIIHLLLQKNININKVDNSGESPLLLASKRGLTNIVNILLENKADPNLYDYNKDSPLLWAAYSGYVDIIKLLIDAGADVYHQYKDRRDALRWAVREKQFESVKILAPYMRDIELFDNYNTTIMTIYTTTEIRQYLWDRVDTNKATLAKYVKSSNHKLIDLNIIKKINSYYSI